MKYILYVVLVCFILTDSIFADDLPDIIGFFEAEDGSWGRDFVAIDANGDRFDDLLICSRESYGGQIYFGRQRMSQFEPDLWISSRFENQLPCINVEYIGRMLPDQNPVVVIFHQILGLNNLETCMLDYWIIKDNFEDEPDYFQSRQYNEYPYLYTPDGFRNKPADVNDDGYNDFVTFSSVDSNGTGFFQIFYGGEEFDTIPDWSVYIDSTGMMASTKYSTGFDINHDNYDDVIYRIYLQQSQHYWYMLYLGGSPMDTLPAYCLQGDSLTGPDSCVAWMQNGFSMFPDVNGDGYDDWGAGFVGRLNGGRRYSGFAIFFGGEQPDAEPDLFLEGSRIDREDVMDITGGDFNDDGYGDIATTMGTATPPAGEVQIHMGSRWIDETADIFINLGRHYNGQYFTYPERIGAVGDYNGDSCDDFVVEGSWRLIIFGGKAEWVSGVNDDANPVDFRIEFTASPNPFNSQVEISYSLISDNRVMVDIYDIQGRHLDNLANGLQVQGDHTLTWSNRNAGLYFVRLKFGESVSYKKVVCLP